MRNISNINQIKKVDDETPYNDVSDGTVTVSIVDRIMDSSFNLNSICDTIYARSIEAKMCIFRKN